MRNHHCHREPITGGLYWVRCATGTVAGREDEVLVRRDPEDGRVGAQAPTDHLRGPAEVPPIEVLFCSACHPGTRVGLPVSREGPTGVVLTGPLPWGRILHARPDNHGIDSQACRSCNSGSKPDGTGTLDRVMHGRRESHCGITRPYRVTLRLPRTTSN